MRRCGADGMANFVFVQYRCGVGVMAEDEIVVTIAQFTPVDDSVMTV